MRYSFDIVLLQAATNWIIMVSSCFQAATEASDICWTVMKYVLHRLQ
jgi:hypothetical protein